LRAHCASSALASIVADEFAQQVEAELRHCSRDGLR
jgi:hypothetical protein